jgi:hypothetical protein
MIMTKLPRTVQISGISENIKYPIGILIQRRVYSKGVTKDAGARLRALI